MQPGSESSPQARGPCWLLWEAAGALWRSGGQSKGLCSFLFEAHLAHLDAALSELTTAPSCTHFWKTAVETFLTMHNAF